MKPEVLLAVNYFNYICTWAKWLTLILTISVRTTILVYLKVAAYCTKFLKRLLISLFKC